MSALAVEKEVNPHFDDFLFDWSTKFQFLVGGYGSSKSCHVVLKIILKLLEEKRTALVVREVYDIHRNSTYSLLEELVNDLDLEGRIKCMTSPMQIRFPNGSKISFKGMDKPQKLKSINNISIVWIEECSEVKYAGFKELLGRLRHSTLKLHMILSTNPVGEDNWSFKHFFKDEINFQPCGMDWMATKCQTCKEMESVVSTKQNWAYKVVNPCFDWMKI